MDNTISIVLPVFNGEAFLLQQLNSIEASRENIHELIICDDNSTDGSVDIILEFKQKSAINVLFIQNTHNSGVNATIKKLLDNATGDYVVFCDQDDIWLDERLSNVISTNADILISNFYVCGEDITEKSLINLPKPSFFSIFVKNHYPGCSIAIKKEHTSKFNIDFSDKLLYDQVLLFQSLFWGMNIKINQEPKFFYRRHNQTVTDYNSIMKDGFFEALVRRLLLLKTLKVRLF